MDAKTFNPKEEFFSAESLPFGRLTVETNSKINYADPEAINFFYLPVKQLKMRILPIMEKLHEMVYLCNFDEQLIPEYISSGVKKLTGYSPADMIQDPGLLFGELIHPEDKKKVYSKISEAISAGNDFKIKYRIITAEGIEKYVINRGRIIKTNDITTAIEGIIEDITEEKILRDKLEHKLKIEKTFSNITANFIGLFNLDEAINKSFEEIGKITNADRIYLFITTNNGLTADNTHEWCAPGVTPHKSVLQDLPIELFPWWTNKVMNNEIIKIEDISDLPEEAAAEKKLLEVQDIKSLIALPLNLNDITRGFVGFDYVNDSKTWCDEDLTILETLANIFSNALTKDQIEKTLLKSEKKYRYLFENVIEQSPVSIFIADTQGSINYLNPMLIQTSGYSKEEFNGKKIDFLLTDLKDSKTYKNIWKAINTGKNWQGDILNKKKNNKFYWERISISPIISNNEITHFVGIKEDITKNKKNYQELTKAKKKAEESDRLKSSFLATINHELRTPLNSIIGFSEIIKETSSEPDTSKAAKIIYDSGLNLLDIINDIIDLSVIDNFKIKLRNETFKLESLFDILKNQLRELLLNAGKENQIKLKFYADPGIPDKTIIADKGKIVQIMLNLSKNAVKFTEQGFIELGIEQKHKRKISFYIKDSGIGISKTQQKVIFDIFRQVDDKLNRKYEGVGIGLAISNKIANSLKGKISVASIPGKGSLFTLTIPIEMSADKQRFTPKESKEIPQLNGFNILVVDDDTTHLLLIKQILQPTAANIYKARNGKEAIGLLEKERKIDLVLMDMKMPGLSGIEVTKIIKENYNIPVIALTAYSSEEKNAIKAGCEVTLPKPIHKKDLYYLLTKTLLF